MLFNVGMTCAKLVPSKGYLFNFAKFCQKITTIHHRFIFYVFVEVSAYLSISFIFLNNYLAHNKLTKVLHKLWIP